MRKSLCWDSSVNEHFLYFKEKCGSIFAVSLFCWKITVSAWNEQLNTSPAIKATLYPCVKKITSGLENLNGESVCSQFFPFFLICRRQFFQKAEKYWYQKSRTEFYKSENFREILRVGSYDLVSNWSIRSCLSKRITQGQTNIVMHRYTFQTLLKSRTFMWEIQFNTNTTKFRGYDVSTS